jgi:hypothetical protein
VFPKAYKTARFSQTAHRRKNGKNKKKCSSLKDNSGKMITSFPLFKKFGTGVRIKHTRARCSQTGRRGENCK